MDTKTRPIYTLSSKRPTSLLGTHTSSKWEDGRKYFMQSRIKRKLKGVWWSPTVVVFCFCLSSSSYTQVYGGSQARGQIGAAAATAYATATAKPDWAASASSWMLVKFISTEPQRELLTVVLIWFHLWPVIWHIISCVFVRYASFFVFCSNLYLILKLVF